MNQPPVIEKAGTEAPPEGNNSGKSPAALPAVEPHADPGPKNGDRFSKRHWPGTRALGIGALAVVAVTGALIVGKANLPLAEANAEVAKVTLDRYVKSGPGTGATLLQIDQQRATVKTTAAQVEATNASIQVNEAAVQRYTDLQGFQKIVAPFPGVITARNVDPGDLISADTPSTTRELFHLMRTDTLRIFVNAPQVFATGIKDR